VPLTGDFSGLKKLESAVQKLASKEPVLESMKREVFTLLRDEFKQGSGPDGETWEPTKRGKPAMVSKKLPFAFGARADRGELRFIGKTKRDLMSALHAGHVFPPRVAKASALRFNSKGSLISAAAFRRALDKRPSGKNPNRKRRYSIRTAAAHTVGERVLPPRPIIPQSGEMPARWQAAVNAGVFRVVAAWAERAQR